MQAILDFVSQYGSLLAEGTAETLYMTLVPTFFAYVLGLPMGVLLTITKAGGIAAAVVFAVVMALLFRPGDKR